MPQRSLFPLNQPLVVAHNIKILKEYYTRHQHIYYNNLINSHFNLEQTRDTRYIPSPTEMPHAQISIVECNPKRDKATNINTIQTQDESTHIYDDTGKYLITIPTTRLTWLWAQYHNVIHKPHGLVLPTQPFETEVIWLYQRYKYKNSKSDPPKDFQHTLPQTILNSITKTFNIIQSYFSSPVTCSTYLTQFHSPFARDKVFGSRGTAFQYKWQGIGYAHPPNEKMAQQAITLGPLSSQKRPLDPHNTSHTRHQLVPQLLTVYWAISRFTYHSPFCSRHHYI